MPFKSRTYEAYYRHKQGATKRGINFYFSFEEWVGWWLKNLGPNWFELRGLKYNQYCMARRKDKGPYASWNVDCITNRENCSGRASNGTSAKGERHHRAKLGNEEVKIIFASSLPVSHLAKAYGVSLNSIYRIKRNEYWTHITNEPRK